MLEPEQRQAQKLIQQLNTIRSDKLEKRKAAKKAKEVERGKKRASEEAKFEAQARERKKRRYALQGSMDARKRAAAEGSR